MIRAFAAWSDRTPVTALAWQAAWWTYYRGRKITRRLVFIAGRRCADPACHVGDHTCGRWCLYAATSQEAVQ